MPEDTGTYQLLVSFPDQSASFAHGFEAGKLWEQMKRWHAQIDAGGAATIACETSTENREIVTRMADNLGWTVSFEASEVEGWDHTTLSKVGPERTKPNPHGLRVVR